MKKLIAFMIALTLTLGFALVGCGGGEEEDSSSTRQGGRDPKEAGVAEEAPPLEQPQVD